MILTEQARPGCTVPASLLLMTLLLLLPDGGLSTTIVYGPTFLKQNIISTCRLPLCLYAKDRTAIS